jgi:hypothetical protein
MLKIHLFDQYLLHSNLLQQPVKSQFCPVKPTNWQYSHGKTSLYYYQKYFYKILNIEQLHNLQYFKQNTTSNIPVPRSKPDLAIT